MNNNNELINNLLDNKYTYNEYIDIYNKLGDEKSRSIYFNRVMYDNTNETKYSLEMIKSMYLDTSFISKPDRKMYKYINFLKTNDNYKKKIIFLGIGLSKDKKDTLMWQFLTLTGQNKNGLDVECIYNNEYGFSIDTTIRTIEVKDINEFFNCDLNNDYLYVIIDRKYNYIENYLLEKNISKNNIFKFDNMIIFSRERQYLDETFIDYKEDEIIIDGGSSNLETTLGFIDVLNNKYEKIYAIEPFTSDYEECNRLIEKYNLKNIDTINCGLWSNDTSLSFNPIGNGSSYIDNEGIEKIDCKSIDSILNGNKATIIKMDIEGSEKEAIIGSKETIKKYHPTLMICVYHKPNDILELVRTVFEIRNDYKLYLRHYSYTTNETVLYFKPNINERN